MEAYRHIRDIGRGAFASCTLVRHRRTGSLAVCKNLHAPLPVDFLCTGAPIE